MVYTRFGTEVTVTGGDVEKGTIDYVAHYKRRAHFAARDIERRDHRISDMKADGGITEIQAEIAAANRCV